MSSPPPFQKRSPGPWRPLCTRDFIRKKIYAIYYIHNVYICIYKIGERVRVECW